MKEIFSAVIKGRQPGFSTFTLYDDLTYSWRHQKEQETGSVQLERNMSKTRLEKQCKQLAIAEAKRHTTAPRIQEFSLCYGRLKGGKTL